MGNQIGLGRLRIGQDVRGGTRVPAGREVEVQTLSPGMSTGEMEIAQIVDSDQAGTRMDERQDVGWDEKCVW